MKAFFLLSKGRSKRSFFHMEFNLQFLNCTLRKSIVHMKLNDAIKSVFNYFIFGNFFIALCAVVMFWQANNMFALNIDPYFIPFIFFSTLCSYSLHWSLTKHLNPDSARLNWTSRHKKFLIGLFIISFICTDITFIPIARFYMTLLPLAFITFMYTAPKIPLKPFLFIRKIAVLKTTYLTLVWVFTTSVLPVLVSGSAWKYETTLFVVNRFFLIYPICVLFDYRDREEDRLEGIKNIATALSSRGLDYVFSICMILNLLSAFMFQNVFGNWFYTAICIVPALLLIFTYRISKNSKSDLWFYFYLDGLMALSGVIVFIVQRIQS